MTLLEFIDRLATQALKRPEEYFRPGHNGPYIHPETEVRIKSHWLITFCKLYKWTGNQKYKAKAFEFAKYLLSQEARPHGYAFFHRNAPKKDKCNGLVGQAWTFEALGEAAVTFEDPEYIKLAEEVFLMHHFNEKHALWNILEIDGKILPIDNAPNHQLWFAAGMSKVESNHSLVHLRTQQFLDKFLENTTILENGLIYHEYDFLPSDAYAKPLRLSLKTRFRSHLKQIFSFINQDEAKVPIVSALERKEKLWDKMKSKSEGYHAFNLYAMSMLYQAYPDHPLWSHDTFRKITHYLSTKEYQQAVIDNQFAFPYNPPGIEVPYALSVFQALDVDQSATLLEYWFRQQITHNFDEKTLLFDRNTKDTTTLTARIYEITRFGKEVLENAAIYESNKNLIN